MVQVKSLDHFQYLINCTPTPPLTQPQSTGQDLCWIRGGVDCTVAQILKTIQTFHQDHINV